MAKMTKPQVLDEVARLHNDTLWPEALFDLKSGAPLVGTIVPNPVHRLLALQGLFGIKPLTVQPSSTTPNTPTGGTIRGINVVQIREEIRKLDYNTQLFSQVVAILLEPGRVVLPREEVRTSGSERGTTGIL